MGVHPKIGITGLPRSGKSAVMQKVIEMLVNERTGEIRARGENPDTIRIIAGMRTEPLIEDGERKGYRCIDIVTGEEAVMAHKDIDTRTRVFGFGIDKETMNTVAIPAIRTAMEEAEVIVIDEIGKFSVESDEFVEIVRAALELDKPTVMTLAKKSRHPLLQDIRRRDDARILEVTPVNRALLPYKIHKLMRETY
ncbi:MAG TPA: nucleotide kinase [Candidatus Thalassarchaeaceae archaeon]|nr:MAG: nucleotide kinase [Euryarchaeota archaeon]RCH73902.1 MAG: nucleotide kinase [Candidatus Poseidoniales archaeon]DAC22494.1 MAG TPA: nucleotide kinase [Candidatus Poseidoniales archaeon]HIH84832.1 nucleotide kinase [Candidatus Thalassarchaeaceae archaeon]|tara:strand:+ start:2511 stop:3095 length:585 start_codon:yes stop_codon:yes gene_type:complete